MIRKWKVIKEREKWWAVSPGGRTAISFKTWEKAIRFALAK